jgi:hydroxypyruvate isomerase
MNYAVNIEPLFQGKDFCEKIRLAEEAGFHAIEFWGWRDKDIKKVRETCREYGVSVAAFCGQQDYSLCDAENCTDYMSWIKQSIEKAKYLDCDTLIVFSNHFTSNGCSDFRNKYNPSALLANVVHTLTLLAPILEESKIRLLLEPLNNLGADVGMVVTDTKTGADIIRAINSPNIQMLCDVFHMQVMHGNLLPNLLENMDIMSYVHIADAPDRHEPGTGEINVPYLIHSLKKNGFNGTICLEFFPSGDSMEALEAAKRSLRF